MSRLQAVSEGPLRRYRDASSHLSPLRYPGGKRKLANYVRLLVRRNDLLDGDYAEVYAGGAAVALSLLFGEYVDRIHINDLDRGVHAFWLAARDHPDEICRRIAAATLDIDEWRRQRDVYADNSAELIDLAFATFYLNRTNRSGILTGGPIGGYEQSGTWRLDARFAKDDLIARIEKIARHRSRIRIYNMDAANFLTDVVPQLGVRALVYLDPPYFVKGQELLYANYYDADDHLRIARLVTSLAQRWVVSYDDTPQIRGLYAAYRHIEYGLAYSAHLRYRGREVMFFSDDMTIPDVKNPSRLRTSERISLELAPT
jgi:DNA adenine methylase